ncbi:unnamed protein product [Polarella glacialis]|uniref:Dienelactone hydrolase domain-containing protein n=1 Tax=Polarella glacialis TaxID=89957 RepID=A0A813HNL2_POLGL|nr:unnamed protein product [Polarella glacialis]CAE8639755.1 unnamed protein product [Polarella glacialis]CAE8706552.1 unnamed protein product [Polarella glacialis]
MGSAPSRSPCCPRGAYGPLANVSSKGLRGSYQEIGNGTLGYVVGGGEGVDKGIIMFSDIFGFDTGRHMQICDMLAERCGCVVICPDFFHSRAPQLDRPMRLNASTVLAMLTRMPRLIHVLRSTKWPGIRQDLDAAVAFLKARGVARAAGLGFCWGGYALWRASGEEDLAPGFLVCGASCHPSVHNCAGMSGDPLTPMEIVSRVRCPQLVLSSKGEPEDWWPGGAVEAAVRGLGDSATAAGSVFRVFEAREHGFVCRGDLDNAAVSQDVDAALEAVVDFFKDKLS